MLNRPRVAGIFGKLSFDPRETLARTALERMLDAYALLMLELWLRHTATGEASIEPQPLSVLRVA